MRAAASPAQPQRCGELCPARLSAATCSQPVAVAVKSVPASGRSAGQGFQGFRLGGAAAAAPGVAPVTPGWSARRQPQLLRLDTPCKPPVTASAACRPAQRGAVSLHATQNPPEPLPRYCRPVLKVLCWPAGR
jgi:hypothetical protein